MKRLAVCVLFLFATAAFAQRGGGHGGGGGFRGGGGGGFRGGGGGGFRGGGAGFSHGGFSRGFSGGFAGGGFNRGFSGGFNHGFSGGFNRGFNGGFNRGFFRSGFGRSRFAFNVGIGYWGYPFYGYGYYPYYSYPYYSYYPYDYYPAYPYYDAGPVIVSQTYAPPPPAPPAQVREYSSGSGEYREPIYLIAFRDHRIQACVAYWVEGDILYYVTREHEQRHVPLSDIDRAFSEQINRDRRVDFRLPR